MKKIAALCAMLIVLLPAAARAAHTGLSDILNDSVAENGAFDGENGVLYASLEPFYYGEEMLLMCRAEGGLLYCSVCAVNDGAECLDTLTLSIPKSGDMTLSSADYDGVTYLTSWHGGVTEYFALLDDSFTHVPPMEFSSEKEIVSFKNGRAENPGGYARNVYAFLNSLRLETINEYPYLNKVNVTDSAALENIKAFLTACSALTEFNRDDYDYDRLFKYVLYTHEAFIPLTRINPHSGESGGIKSVSGEFIDYIMTDILGVTPEHPPVTALTERGFCYRSGFYQYTGGFSADFRTEIAEILLLHDLGGGNYHVVFSDIYYEDGASVPEYSFAVIHDEGGSLSLIRLGMGKNLLTPQQISQYADGATLKPAWEQSAAPATTVPEGREAVRRNGGALAAALFLAFLTAIVSLLWLKYKRGRKS